MKKLSIILTALLVFISLFTQVAFAGEEPGDSELWICFNDAENSTKAVNVIDGGMWDNSGTTVSDEKNAAVVCDTSGETPELKLTNYSYSGTGYKPDEADTAYGIYAELPTTLDVYVDGTCSISVLRSDNITTCGACFESTKSYGLYFRSYGEEPSTLNVNTQGTNSYAFESTNVIFNGLTAKINVKATETGVGFNDNCDVFFKGEADFTAQTSTCVIPENSNVSFADYDSYQKVIAGETSDKAKRILIPTRCSGFAYLHIEPLQKAPEVLVCFTDPEYKEGDEPFFLDVIDGGNWNNNGEKVTDPSQANVSYNKDTDTLTLNGYVYESIGLPIVNMEGNQVTCTAVYIDNGTPETTIDLKGNNNLKVYHNNLGDSSNFGIYGASTGDVSFKGNGYSTLNVWVDGKRGDSGCIGALRDITFNTKAKGQTPEYHLVNGSKSSNNCLNSYGVVTYNGEIHIKNSSFYAKSGEAWFLSNGIRVGSETGSLKIENSDVELYSSSADASSCIVGSCLDTEVTSETNINNIIITDSKVYAKAGDGGCSRAIDTSGNVIISGKNAKVYAYGSKSKGKTWNYGIGLNRNLKVEDQAYLYASSITGFAIHFYNHNEEGDVICLNYGSIPACYVAEDGETPVMLDDPTKCAAKEDVGEYRQVEIKPATMTSNSETYKLGSRKQVVLKADVDNNTFDQLTLDGDELTKGTDYTVEKGSTVIKLKPDVLERLKLGKHTFEGTWKTTFAGTGTLSKEITVVDATSIEDCEIILSHENFEFNNRVQIPNVTLSDPDGNTLEEDKDYKFELEDSKNVGTYAVTVEGIGAYKGGASVSYKINPASKSIKSIKAGKKKLTVKWTKRTGAYKAQTTGYQIRYSTSKSFKNSKTAYVKVKYTSKTIKKLKRHKKYYVKMRAYKTVNGQKYYSNWSKVKIKKTR